MIVPMRSDFHSAPGRYWGQPIQSSGLKRSPSINRTIRLGDAMDGFPNGARPSRLDRWNRGKIGSRGQWNPMELPDWGLPLLGYALGPEMG